MAEDREAKIARACEAAGCTPYAAELLLDGITHAAGMVTGRHLTAEEVIAGVACVSTNLFGMLAMMVLRENGIPDGAHVGALATALCREGLLQRGPDDCVEQFERISGHLEVFARRVMPVIEKTWGAAWAV